MNEYRHKAMKTARGSEWALNLFAGALHPPLATSTAPLGTNTDGAPAPVGRIREDLCGWHIRAHMGREDEGHFAQTRSTRRCASVKAPEDKPAKGASQRSGTVAAAVAGEGT